MNDKLFVRANEDDLSLRTPFINVEELKNVPLVPIPSTAQEYLVSVMAERQNIQEVTQCTVDYTKFRQNQSLFFDQEPLPLISDKLKPTKEWQNIQVADFSDARNYLSRMRNKKKEMSRVKRFHCKRDADPFWWRCYYTKYRPNLTIIFGFTAAQLDIGLDNLTKLMKLTPPGETIEDYIGRWSYASLACLKTPLHSDTVSIIRKLAEECWKVRSHLDPEQENAVELAAPLTLIICIVGRYYEQLDLADSLE